MTALLEFKQKIKTFYSKYDMLLLPFFKFLLAFVLFRGINSSMGFFEKLDNIFIVLIFSVICAILPINAMTVLGCAMIIAHCYAVGIEVAGFAILLILLLVMLFLRFTSKENLALVLTPVAFNLHIPAAVPLGSGLLRGPACAVPSGCGIVLYFFMKIVKDKSTVLQGKETEIVQKLQILLDALLKDQEIWLNLLVFVMVIMTVYIISRCSFDYSWRVADAAGAVMYIVVMVVGGMFLDIDVKVGSVILTAVISFMIGLVIEFAVLGVDYSRSEYTQFEDDEYVYYVKAVPKSYVAKKEKSIKTISSKEELRTEDEFKEETAPVEMVEGTEFDFEKQLEESLRDL